MKLSVWIKAVRIRFLFASIIGVLTGLTLAWQNGFSLQIIDALITLAGVVSLHVSVDLLNDYWDFKRGIDTNTIRTKTSGGSGVLPNGLLKPSSVYFAGIGSLILGTLIGIYFVITQGIIIALILGFAVFSIFFYSTKIVDSGLSEVFVTVKGTMIVIGTFFIQTTVISIDSVLGGIFLGILSSLVLFVTSFPDHDADKSGGRKTLVIIFGKKNGTYLFWIFPTMAYSCIIFGILLNIFPLLSAITLLGFPIIIKAGIILKKNYNSTENLVQVMNNSIIFGRVTGVLFATGFILNFYLF